MDVFAQAAGNSELARRLIERVRQGYEGDTQAFFSFLVDEGITGWDLFSLAQDCGRDDDLFFVVNIDLMRREISEDSRIIYPKYSSNDPLSDAGQRILKSFHITTLIAERLLWISDNLNIRLAEISEDINIPRQTLSEWATGRGTQNIFELMRVCEYLKLRTNINSIDIKWLVAQPVHSLGFSVHRILTLALEKRSLAMGDENRRQLAMF